MPSSGKCRGCAASPRVTVSRSSGKPTATHLRESMDEAAAGRAEKATLTKRAVATPGCRESWTPGMHVVTTVARVGLQGAAFWRQAVLVMRADPSGMVPDLTSMHRPRDAFTVSRD
jgi:hypothetical protein